MPKDALRELAFLLMVQCLLDLSIFNFEVFFKLSEMLGK
jgi:hypothetical protein